MVVDALQRYAAVSEPVEFERFYQGERSGLYRALALTLGDAELAAEAVDEAFVRAYQRWGRVGRYDNPAGWVYRVARNWATSRLRKLARVQVVEAVPDAAPVDPPGEPDEELAAALAALSEPQRAVVVLRFHLDWSTEQAAHALGVAPGTVKSRLHRVLGTLRDALGEAS